MKASEFDFFATSFIYTDQELIANCGFENYAVRWERIVKNAIISPKTTFVRSKQKPFQDSNFENFVVGDVMKGKLILWTEVGLSAEADMISILKVDDKNLLNG